MSSLSQSPFDKDKYERLLDRLEVIEVELSSLLVDNSDFRIDDKMFSKLHIKIKKQLNIINSKKMIELSMLITDFGAFSQMNFVEFLDSGVLFLKNHDIKNNYIDTTDSQYVSEDVFNALSLKLEENDILIPRVGSLGNAAVIKREYLPCTANQNLAKIKLKEEYFPYYIASYLNTRFAKIQIDSISTGNVQQWLNLENIGKLLVPTFSPLFQKSIEKTVLFAHDAIIQSTNFYNKAQELLLSEIKLLSFNLTNNPISTKTFLQSFKETGRLDAEYYQPKYDDYLKKIFSYKNGWEKLSDACNVKDTNYTPHDKEMYSYIELSNIGNYGEITGCMEEIGIELPSRARRKVNTGDVIISAIEGSLSSCAIVSDFYDNALCSTGFYVINSNKINPETLLILFKSELMQNLLKQNCSGTILTAINKEEFKNLPIPLIDSDTQKAIAKLIQESASLREKSKQLLEYAKQAVEMAIEEGEEKAIQWLEEVQNGSL